MTQIRPLYTLAVSTHMLRQRESLVTLGEDVVLLPHVKLYDII